MASDSERGARLLLTFAGRKGAWCRALLASPEVDLVVACDADPLAAVRLAVPEFELVPRADQQEAYLARLLEVCSAHDVDAVVPLNDLDLGVLASARERFLGGGVRVATADRLLVGRLADKVEAARFLAARGLPTVPTRPFEEVDAAIEEWGFPLAVKARRGQGSAGLVVAGGREDLPVPGQPSVVQPFVRGEEFHLDLLINERGEAVRVAPKRKLAMFQGSTDKAEWCDDESLVRLGAELGGALGSMLGSVDVDVLRSDDGDRILDVNPRLGGGFPFTAIFDPTYVDAFAEICTGGSGARGPAEPRRRRGRIVRDSIFLEDPGP